MNQSLFSFNLRAKELDMFVFGYVPVPGREHMIPRLSVTITKSKGQRHGVPALIRGVSTATDATTN